MNVLFITLLDLRSVGEHNLYADLLRVFSRQGHRVCVVSPVERKHGMSTCFYVDDEDSNVSFLKVRTGNIQKTNVIEKGISTLLLEYQLTHGIKKYLSDKAFDLILYSTPPITIVKPVEYIKRGNQARTYLLLKDIFPQNAVDLEMLSKTGVKGLLYRYFRRKERKLYDISDRIGCMSLANAEYIHRNNPELDADKIEVCPNSIEVQDMTLSEEERRSLRQKYGIPLDKRVFVYGGNLGKPQGIPFLIQCLKSQETNPDAFFLIVGDGTEFGRLEEYFRTVPANMCLMKSLPRDDYDRMIAACDVGLIFLDHRFTIPNFPSRLLSYMQAGLPVLACTDPNTDVGKVIVDGGFGWWCESNDPVGFSEMVSDICGIDTRKLAEASVRYLKSNYSSTVAYETINRFMSN